MSSATRWSATASRCSWRGIVLDKNKVRINRGDDNLELRAKHVLIACGTEPARPANVPFTPGQIIDSNELLQMTTLPRSMVIVGGGVIGVEYACMMSAVGREGHIGRRAGPDCSNLSMMSWPSRFSFACATWECGCAWGESVSEIRAAGQLRRGHAGQQ